MKFIEILKNFAPGFVGSFMGGVLIAIIVGQNPSNISLLEVFKWIIALFILGVIFT